MAPDDISESWAFSSSQLAREIDFVIPSIPMLQLPQRDLVDQLGVGRCQLTEELVGSEDFIAGLGVFPEKPPVPGNEVVGSACGGCRMDVRVLGI